MSSLYASIAGAKIVSPVEIQMVHEEMIVLCQRERECVPGSIRVSVFLKLELSARFILQDNDAAQENCSCHVIEKIRIGV